MITEKIWEIYNESVYLFILKRVKNKQVANDIFQNTFLKIHNHLPSLKDDSKIKAWVFQIARNEINNHFNTESHYVKNNNTHYETDGSEFQAVCCFDKLIHDLPDKYREVIELVYVKGYKQKEVAISLGISLENTKARVRRAKILLKEKFKACCNYEVNQNGKLVGEPNCSTC